MIGARRDLVELFDEPRTFGAQALDHVPVVDDLVADVDRRAVLLERPLDDLDGPDDPGAKAAGLREDHSHGRTLSRTGSSSMTWRRSGDAGDNDMIHDALLRAAGQANGRFDGSHALPPVAKLSLGRTP